MSHSTSAVVHDAGDIPVMQTLEALPYVTRTAREIIERGSGDSGSEQQYILNPVAIGIRGNPFGDRPNVSKISHAESSHAHMVSWPARLTGVYDVHA